MPPMHQFGVDMGLENSPPRATGRGNALSVDFAQMPMFFVDAFAP